jgi:LacI family transcriptional regulator
MTVKEVSELAGVSIGTVDRVLHKRGRVSAQTKERIEEIIEKFQFTLNPIARRLKRSRAYTFCAFLPRGDQDAGYWNHAIEGIKSGAAELSPLGVDTEVIEFDRYAKDIFTAASEALLALSPDGIILAPVLPEKTRPFILEMQARHIPIVTIDAVIPDAPTFCSISQDPFRGGYLAGRLLHLFSEHTQAPVAVLDPHGEDYHIARRRDGFLAYTSEYGIASVVQEYSDNRGTELSVEEISLFLDEHPRLSGIFITNCLAHRVAEAAAQSGRQNIPIVGYDLIPDNRALLKAGRLSAIISQRLEAQGHKALFSLFRGIVLEQTVPKKIPIPLDVFIRENVED